MTPTADDTPIVGKSYRLFYNEGNHNNKKMHIRAIVDGDIIVYRYWRYGKQRWQYIVDDMIFWEVFREHIFDE